MRSQVDQTNHMPMESPISPLRRQITYQEQSFLYQALELFKTREYENNVNHEDAIKELLQLLQEKHLVG